MCLQYLFILGVCLACGLAGCTPPEVQTVWPEPRPLGRELPVYQPPPQPPVEASPAREVREPTGVVTLAQAQALALLQNPRLVAFGWEVRAREAQILQAGLLPNPEVGVEVENFAGSGALQKFRSTEITILLSQLIELGGKRGKRVRVAALESTLAAWDYETTRIEVLTQVTQAFVEVLSAQEHVRLNEDLVRLAEQVLNTVAERVRAGKVSPVEETRFQVALSTSRIALERAQRDLEASRKRLVTTCGGRTPTFASAAGTLDTVSAIPPAERLLDLIAQNPEIARWATEMVQRQAALEREEAQRIPDPTLRGGFRHLSETGDNALVMGVSIPLPVFNRNQGKVLEARYRLAKVGEERRAAEAQVRAALAEAYGALSRAFVEATRLHTEVLPGAQRVFNAISEGYRQGKFGLLDVLDAQRTLFEARGRYLEALAAYHQAVAEVERLIGERLGSVTEALGSQPYGGK
jgi:cobalt-zinc-cadmium efflux system outer membrane protein